jgi:hypothetical protein
MEIASDRELELLRKIERLVMDNQMLKQALAPFANLADKIHKSAPDEAALVLTTLDGGIIDTHNRVTAGNLRRARAAITN